jgi:hypothetical protein
VQVACTYSSEEIKERKMIGLFVGCLSIACALFINVYTDYIEQIAKANYKNWDVKTITAADYTVEVDIPKGLYKSFI